MNDVDYLNLQQSDETQNVTSNQVMSRINAYYSSEDNYIGAYFKHYQYLNLESNGRNDSNLADTPLSPLFGKLFRRLPFNQRRRDSNTLLQTEW
jgi:hypothetical protein